MHREMAVLLGGFTACAMACGAPDVRADASEQWLPPDAGVETRDAGADAGASSAPVLALTVTNFRSARGQLCVAVFPDAAGFPDDESAVVFQTCVVDLEATLEVPGLVEGADYAISVFHDENGNAELDTTFGIAPAEGFGFSNDPPIRFGAPGWDECRFTFDEAHRAMSIRLTYLF